MPSISLPTRLTFAPARAATSHAIALACKATPSVFSATCLRIWTGPASLSNLAGQRPFATWQDNARCLFLILQDQGLSKGVRRCTALHMLQHTKQGKATQRRSNCPKLSSFSSRPHCRGSPQARPLPHCSPNPMVHDQHSRSTCNPFLPRVYTRPTLARCRTTQQALPH